MAWLLQAGLPEGTRRHPFAAGRDPVTLPCTRATFTEPDDRLAGRLHPEGLASPRRNHNMDRFSKRRETLREDLGTLEVDALLVSSLTNVAYLTGFTGDSATLLVGRDRDVILSDGR